MAMAVREWCVGLAACAALVGAAGEARADLRYEESVRIAGEKFLRQTALRADRRCIVTCPDTGARSIALETRADRVVEITRLDRAAFWIAAPGAGTEELSFDRVRDLVRVSRGEVAAGKSQPLKAMYRAERPALEIGAPAAG